MGRGSSFILIKTKENLLDKVWIIKIENDEKIEWQAGGELGQAQL